MGARWVALSLVLGSLSACLGLPTEPGVLVLPAVGKPMDVFQAEEGACRTYAQQQLGGAAAPAASVRWPQERYDIAYVQCMYAKGNTVPGVLVAPGSSVPPPPPGTPPPPSPGAAPR